jgi:uncharacterized protein (TIGR02722 family)
MKHIALGLLAFPFALAGCSSLEYDDPTKVETLTIDFGSTDLQMLSGHMVESLIRDPKLSTYSKSGDDPRIVLYFGGIDNRTTEHIDTGGISDAIRVPLLQSGKFRIVAGQQGQGEIGDQVRFQQGSGRVDPEQAKAFGRQLGADMILYGTLRSIEKSKPRSPQQDMKKKDDVWYQFTLEAADITTGEIIWADQKEIRKTQKAGIFGA